MPDPIDHWLDLDIATPREPLRQEMYAAVEQAANSPAGERRALWTGVATGYAIAFGLFTRDALDKARLVPGALTVHPDDYSPGRYGDEETAWACGVLHGYYMGTSEGLDVTTCAQCGQRRVHDVDEVAACEHGDFCPDCVSDWHRGLYPNHTGGLCSYWDGLR